MPLFSNPGRQLRRPLVPSWVETNAVGQPAADQADFSAPRYWSDGRSYASLSEFFAANGSAFTRASTATYRDATPLLASAAINALRFQHDAAGSPLGVLLEGSRQNIAVPSENFGSGWQLQTNTARTSGQGTGPDGANSLWLISRTVTTASTYFIRNKASNFAVSSSTQYTVEVFAKAREFTWLYLDNVGTGGDTDFLAYFNLATGAVGTSFNCTPRMEDWGNGIYRCILTFTTGGAQTAVSFDIGGTTQDNNSTATAGSAGDGFLIFGAGFEAGAFRSAYIPALAADTTRAIDTYTQTVTASATGAVVIEGRTPPGASGNQVLWQKDDGTAANRIRLVRNGTSLNLVVTNASVDTTKVIGALANDTAFKVALRWAANDFAASLNGAAAVTEAGPAVPAGLTNIRYGRGVSAEGWFGTIKSYARFDNDNIDVVAKSA